MDRLITDLNMVGVWEAVSAVPDDPGLPTEFLDAVRELPRWWRAMSKLPRKELEAELKKVARKVRELAKLLRGNAAEILYGRGILELGPLVRAAQGHDYMYGVDLSGTEDPHDLGGSDHLCPVYQLLRVADVVDDQCKKLRLPHDRWEFDPPSCPSPEFNPLTREADGSLPFVEKLLEALGEWLETPLTRKGDGAVRRGCGGRARSGRSWRRYCQTSLKSGSASRTMSWLRRRSG